MMILLLALMFYCFSHCAVSINVPYNSSVTSHKEQLTLQVCKLHPGGEGCNYNKYIVQLKAAYEELFVQMHAPPTRKLIRIEIVSSKLTYVNIFEQYIMKSRPFKGLFTDTDPSIESSLKLVSVVDDSIQPFETSISNLSKVEQNSITSMLKVPQLAGNNYLRKAVSHCRTQLQTDPELEVEDAIKEEDSSEQCVLKDYFDKWPYFQSLEENRPSRALACPANMHLLAWSYAVDPLAGAITARLFDLKSSARYFGTDVFNESYSLRVDAPIHFDTFLRHGFGDQVVDANSSSPDDDTDSRGALPAYSEVVLGHGEYLFVPNSYVSSFMCANSTGPLLNSRCPLLTLCLVDASNLNLFRSSLLMHGKVFSGESKLFESLTSPGFLSSIMRSPVELSVTDYRGGFSLTSAESPSRSNISEDLSAADKKPSPAGGRDRRKKTGSKTSDFREWQDLSKWNLLVASLTLPMPTMPRIASTGRDNATISWHSSYTAASADKVDFGFNLLYCRNAPDAFHIESMLLPYHKPTAGTDANCNVSSFSRSLGNLRESIDIEALKASGIELLSFEVDLKHLVPSTTYQVRVSVFYGQAESTSSDFSHPFRTHSTDVPSVPLAYPFTEYQDAYLKASVDKGRRPLGIIQFTWPVDDGGLPLLGFHVFTRRFTAAGTIAADWTWMGLFGAENIDSIGFIEVSNLMPSNQFYQFKISAHNALGNSTLSGLSNRIEFDVSDATMYIVYGQGSENYLGSLSAGYLHSNAELHSADEFAPYCRQDMLEIHARDEVMISKNCYNSTKPRETGRHEIWRSHSTLPQLEVVAEFIIAMPIRLDYMLEENNNLMRGRIAVCVRGIVPFAEKALIAQRAGAIALLVIDEGQCNKYDQRCLPGANKRNKEGFGILDLKSHWDDVGIPVFFILKTVAFQWFIGLDKETLIGDEGNLRIFENFISSVEDEEL